MKATVGLSGLAVLGGVWIGISPVQNHPESQQLPEPFELWARISPPKQKNNLHPKQGEDFGIASVFHIITWTGY